jgi:hypothetical protein
MSFKTLGSEILFFIMVFLGVLLVLTLTFWAGFSVYDLFPAEVSNFLKAFFVAVSCIISAVVCIALGFLYSAFVVIPLYNESTKPTPWKKTEERITKETVEDCFGSPPEKRKPPHIRLVKNDEDEK